MPETTAQNAQESHLITGADASAPQAGADPLGYWEALTLDPCFILTSTNAPSQDAALENLLEAVKIAADQAPGATVVLAEGWPTALSEAPTESDLAAWKKMITVYHDQYLALAVAVQDAFPALNIQIFPLASELVALLDTPELSDVAPTALFAPEDAFGAPALTALAAVLTGSALSDVPLTDTPEALPGRLTDDYDEIVKLAHIAVGGSLTAPAQDTDRDSGSAPAPVEPTTPVEPAPAPITDFIGSDGDDLIDLTADLARVDGGAGIDTLAVAALSEAATITFGSDGRVQLNIDEDAPVVLQNVERVAFEDGTLAFDADGLAGQAYRLYQACFDRTPDTEGLGFWIRQLDAGNVTLTQAANFFIGSEEFAEVYGAPQTLGDVHYLALLYANVLGRTPETEGVIYWRDQQDNGIARADMLVYFSESTENVDRVSTAIDDGIWYI
ncbi:DUF4214 domain-containing protein [Sulfitobacter mediterraneus]|uniref:DUF4214 domain-containing protein n=1 Tax=Sulfitobacter mediterraneus TaxID=83219 RepID=UPI0024931FDA|nr:DUF4214 domain-containing protein [Sulfitobacter mediterraneus]